MNFGSGNKRLLYKIISTNGIKKITDVLHATNPSIYGGGEADISSYLLDQDAIPVDVAYALYTLSFLHGYEDATNQWHRLRLDASHYLKTAPQSSPHPANRSSFVADSMDVAIAGTGERMPALVIPDGFQVTIKAKHTNGAALIYLATTKLRSETAGERFTLRANESKGLKITNLNLVWINTSVNAKGVEYSVET